MKLKELSQEEIDAMSYDDIAYLVLKDSDKKMKITDLFKKVCKALNLDEATYESKIAYFFELLTTDKKFILLDNGYWDLSEKHTQKIKINDDDDDSIEVNDDIEDIDLDEVEEEEEEDIFYESDETDDESENDLKDLVVIDEDEEINS